MTVSRSSIERWWFIPLLLLIIVLIGLTWMNYRFAFQNPGGSDFLVHWVGTRNLLVDGVSPYGDETTEQIQQLVYGRPAHSGEDELRITSPLYSGMIYTPFALIGDYTLARALWMTLLEAALLGMAFVCLRLNKWNIRTWMLFVYLLFSLLWYHAVKPLLNGDAVILVALFIAGAVEAIRQGRDEVAGVLLAVSTIKPQVVVLIIPFVIFWSITVKRWKVLIWLLISLVILFVSAMVFVPDWPLQNLYLALRYTGDNQPGTPGAVFSIWWPVFGVRLGWGLTLILGIVLLIECYLVRGKDFRWFHWTAGLTLVVSQWIGIRTDPGNFIILFIPIVLIFATWEERWGVKRGRIVVLLGFLVLFVGLWAIFLASLENADQPQQIPIMFFPLPILILIGLFWVRWWAIRPAKLLVEALKAGDL